MIWDCEKQPQMTPMARITFGSSVYPQNPQYHIRKCMQAGAIPETELSIQLTTDGTDNTDEKT